MQAEKCSVGLALGRLAAVVAVLFPGTQAVSRDWPMWRCDPQRTASTVAALPLPLHMKWLRRYPVTTPAWPDQPRLRFDTHYEPVVVGRNLFLGSPRSDWVVALDTETGEERWRTYLDGPVRFAPTAWRDRLFVACDDGYLYCLSVRDGAVVWKIPGAPNAKRRILGNGRLISTWPVRGAPVVSRDRVYFAAGIWPFMGVFIHCVDAETGRAIWCNSGTGSEWCGQPHV
ncbi:MAG: PQQ-like beta-propeller repeat protein, partial [Kiritimatiellae bacterium]|nr:PQQ-like beta-propeller repeat protein [Kiritimatiellia bacterium]